MISSFDSPCIVHSDFLFSPFSRACLLHFCIPRHLLHDNTFVIIFISRLSFLPHFIVLPPSRLTGRFTLLGLHAPVSGHWSSHGFGRTRQSLRTCSAPSGIPISTFWRSPAPLSLVFCRSPRHLTPPRRYVRCRCFCTVPRGDPPPVNLLAVHASSGINLLAFCAFYR